MITVSQTPEICFSFYTSFLEKKKFGKNSSAVQLSKSINPCPEIKGKSLNCIAFANFKNVYSFCKENLAWVVTEELITAFIL